MSEEGIDQPAPSKPALRHTTQGGRLTVTRKAPLPPKLSLNETSALTVRYVNGVTFSLPEYINIKSETNSPKKCLSSVINLLIEKEKQYVLKLKVDLDDLENVSTEACNKLPLMKNILDFHARDLLQCFLYSSDPSDISNLFITYKNKLRLYIIFARTKKDFSYLVMDVCENIIDHFKARLLEYNFTVSEIRSIYINDVEITTSCDEAEKVIKKLYRKINQHLVCEEIQE